MIQTVSQLSVTLFTLALSLNIFIHDMNLDKATQEVVARKFNSEVSSRGPSANLHTHAEGPSIKTIDPREKKKRSPLKNHQHLRKKRTQRPTPPTHSSSLAFN